MRFPSIFKRKPKECHDCDRKEGIMKNAARAMDDLLVGKAIDELEPGEMMSLYAISQTLRFSRTLIVTKLRKSPYRDRTGNEVESMYEVMRNNFVHYMGMLAADIQAMFLVDSPIRDVIGERYKKHTDSYLWGIEMIKAGRAYYKENPEEESDTEKEEPAVESEE